MDKEKLKKWAGYAGLGILGGFLLFMFMSGGDISYFPIEILLFPSLGGLLGGVIAKKWWGALVGGFILFGLMVFIALWAWASMW